jgi:hypothetical protein
LQEFFAFLSLAFFVPFAADFPEGKSDFFTCTSKNSHMIKRHLQDISFADIFERQMRFIAGPRQVGKTMVYSTASQPAGSFYNSKKETGRMCLPDDPIEI